eukprot:2889115-Pyramimonas_sp.AAC.1
MRAGERLVELRAALPGGGDVMETRVREYMMALLEFPLMGRPRRKGKDVFSSSIHCYWAKFFVQLPAASPAA